MQRLLQIGLCCCFAGFSILVPPTCAQKSKPKAAEVKPNKKQKEFAKALNKLPLKTPEDKKKMLEYIRYTMPTRVLAKKIQFSSLDLDKSLKHQIGLTDSGFAKRIDDEAFLRRACLDTIGSVPDAEVVEKFVASTDPRKRRKLIDELLEMDEFGRNWARYWTSVIFYESSANKNRVNRQALEDWLSEQFQQNQRWDRITAELVSAMPKYKKGKKEDKNDWGQKHGPNNFVLSCDNKPGEIAAKTARLFMGISIQCAECHDHPFDQWKREQFHELTAFFSPGSYYMTDSADPTEKTKMQAKFLLGEKPVENLKADVRRVAVAAYLIYNPSNYWFARAYVNRVWSQLLGDGFYAVDSLGPDAEVIHKTLVNRIASMFRYRDFDTKWLFRLVMNSEAYQRDIRTIDSQSDLFTAVRPTRLRGDHVATAVEKLVGPDANLSSAVKTTFDLNPSVAQRNLEGSIQQALLLMNNKSLQSKLISSELKKRVVAMKSDNDAVAAIYLGTLARKPQSQEMTRSLAYLRESDNRNEAIDDLIWVLVNSTEFITKR